MSGAAPVVGRQSPLESIRHLRIERDRHVAFAFAAADLLIEVSLDGTIIAASGATHAILGADTRDLAGRPITDFMAEGERPLVRQLIRQVSARYRIDPTVLRIMQADGATSNAVIGGCRLPDRSNSIFLSVAMVPDALVVDRRPRDQATGLLTADALRTAAQRISGGAKQLQLVRLDGLSGAAGQLPANRAAMLMQEIGAAMRASSIGGDAAGRLGEDAFGILTRPGQELHRDAALAADLAEVIREAGIPDGQVVAPRVARIDISLGTLSNSEAGHVLSHAMNAFAKSVGGDFDIGALQAGLTAAIDDAVSRFAETRQVLTEGRFTVVYQPVTDLATRTIHHYEALSRFADGASTYETVVFGEDVGLIMEFDLTVARQVIKAIERGGTARVAVNLSGRSVQNDAFRNALIRIVGTLGDSQRLLFELTELATITEMAEAEGFLSRLRGMGHAICLDDFGAGATAYNYLRRFDVDFVKIDGPFLKAAGERGRDRALIRSICVLSGEIGCKVIGEMIEDETAASLAATLGIGFGQGWLFGKPIAELPMPIRSIRRKGGTETWQ